MKKSAIIFFVLTSFFIQKSLIFTAEGKIEFKLPDKPQKYENPVTEREAINEWDKTVRQEQEAQKAKKEAQEQLSHTNDRMNSAKNKPIEWAQAEKDNEVWLRNWVATKNIMQEWSARKAELEKNKLVKQYVSRLENIYEKPVGPSSESFREPIWWTKLHKRMEAWIKNRQIDYYSWIGNKEKIVQIRLDLADLYTKLGKGGLLGKARANKELSRAISETDKKIGKALSALENYSQAIRSRLVKEQDQDNIKNEVKEVIVDLATLKDELEEAEFDDKIRTIIDEKIDKILKEFGITDQEKQEFTKDIGEKIVKQDSKDTVQQVLDPDLPG